MRWQRASLFGCMACHHAGIPANKELLENITETIDKYVSAHGPLGFGFLTIFNKKLFNLMFTANRGNRATCLCLKNTHGARERIR